ncbi:WD repeat-containing protein 27-like [Uloborus diversus]|uniref:WD repeat-containing protein 27-like n=1 Tax=Uloborus diversus TaxID=327109 RepID=UPI00240A77CB|nr:WD repeat-containing protein 27-like [Uloborus diversus]
MWTTNAVYSVLSAEEENEIGLVRSALISRPPNCSKAVAVVTPLMNDSLILIKFPRNNIIAEEAANESALTTSKDTACDAQLTFLYSGNKDEDSILYQPMPKLHQPQKKKVEQKKSKNNLSFPVTFHSRVKSSGYGVVQISSRMFQPKINKRSPKEVKHSQSLMDFQNLSLSANTRQHSESLNSFEIEPPSFKPENCSLIYISQISDTPAVSLLQITADGKFASCTSSGGIVHILKLRKESFDISASLNCHKGSVNSCSWNHKGRLFITCGVDQTAKIWNLNSVHQNPVLTFGMECNQNLSSPRKKKFRFKEEVEQAQFYYLDKFILAASGNALHIFDYKIHMENSGIRNNINKSCSKLIKRIPLNMKKITTFAAINQFFSSILFTVFL